MNKSGRVTFRYDDHFYYKIQNILSIGNKKYHYDFIQRKDRTENSTWIRYIN